MRLLGNLILIAITGFASWWFLLREPDRPESLAAADPPIDVSLLVQPVMEPPLGEEEEPTGGAPPAPSEAEVPEVAPEPEPEPEPEPLDEQETAPPPPPEAGTPDGDPEGEDQPVTQASPSEEDAAEPETPEEAAERAAAVATAALRDEMKEIDETDDLLERAQEEVTDKTRRGFQTVFYSRPRDQLAIARYFGETMALVPRSGLRPGREYYYRLVLDEGEPRIETVRERAPEGRGRSLIEFSYESLPTPLRELRRRVFVRGDIHHFGAILPPREWGLVILRREAALRACNEALGGTPRAAEDVKVFVMGYVRMTGGAFDIRVREIHFADGTKWKVPQPS